MLLTGILQSLNLSMNSTKHTRKQWETHVITLLYDHLYFLPNNKTQQNVGALWTSWGLDFNSSYHWMAQVGTGFKDHLVLVLQPQTSFPTTEAGTRLGCQAWSNVVLNTTRDGTPTTSLGSLLQHLSVKNFPLTSNINLLTFSLKPHPLMLLLSDRVKSVFFQFISSF